MLCAPLVSLWARSPHRCQRPLRARARLVAIGLLELVHCDGVIPFAGPFFGQKGATAGRDDLGFIWRILEVVYLAKMGEVDLWYLLLFVLLDFWALGPGMFIWRVPFWDVS